MRPGREPLRLPPPPNVLRDRFGNVCEVVPHVHPTPLVRSTPESTRYMHLHTCTHACRHTHTSRLPHALPKVFLGACTHRRRQASGHAHAATGLWSGNTARPSRKDPCLHYTPRPLLPAAVASGTRLEVRGGKQRRRVPSPHTRMQDCNGESRSVTCSHARMLVASGVISEWPVRSCQRPVRSLGRPLGEPVPYPSSFTGPFTLANACFGPCVVFDECSRQVSHLQRLLRP